MSLLTGGHRGLLLVLVLLVWGCSHDDAALGGKSDGGCLTGSETCACFGNSTCLDGLTCASNLCVRLGAGGSGGSSGPGQGGVTGTGGAVASGGATGSGGMTGTGGAPGSGGSGAATGTGGATGNGGTTGTGGAIGNGGTTGTGGATGSGGMTGTGGAPGSGGSGAATGTGGATGGDFLLLPDSGGKVTNAGAGIVGAWYSATDATPNSTGTGHCVRDQATTCSAFAAGSPAQGGAFGPTDSPITIGKMCASGTVATVVTDPGSPSGLDYSGIWGAVIGFGFNGYASGTTATASNGYNAPAQGIVGVSFDIDMVPFANSALSFRVEFPTAAVPGTTDADSAYWNGATSNGSPVTVGKNVVLWSNVLGPMYDTAPPAFDPSQVVAVQFHVTASSTGPTPFNFCISNLTALTSP